MKKIILILLIGLTLMLQGCNTGVAFSLFGDLVELRVQNELDGKPHIEDLFKEEVEH